MKKYSIEVDEDLHRKLKDESRKRNTTMKSLCTDLLNSGLGGVDPSIFYLLPLDSLRQIHLKLITEKPENWLLLTRKIDNEIRRRFKV